MTDRKRPEAVSVLDAVSGLGRLRLRRPLAAMWQARTAIRPFRFPKNPPLGDAVHGLSQSPPAFRVE